MIPGCSTIDFDEIAKERIYKSIDDARFNDIELIKTSYKNLTGWVLRRFLEKIDPGEKTITVPRKELEKIYDALGDLLGLRG